MSSMSFVPRIGVLFLAIVAASCGSRKEGTAPPEQSSQALAGPIFNETWEGGTHGWIDRSNSPPVLVSDPDAPSNTVQEISRATSGGDYFSPLVDVAPSEVYCVSTRVKWVSGGAPFLAIQRFGASANQLDFNWIIGVSYTDPLGPVAAVSPSTTGWQTVSRTLTMPADTTQIRVVSELWDGASKGGGELAYLDDIAIAAGACAAGASVPYVQGWESGAGGWADKTGGSPTVVTDATSPSGSAVQMIDRATSGGDYFSPQIAVTAGNVYCVSTLVKWVSGGAPFLGIQRFDSGGSAIVLNWIIGVGYTDPLGAVTEVSPSVTGWQTVSHTLTMPAGTTQIRLVSELYGGASKGGNDVAYLDDIGIAAGACAAAVSVPYVQGWESGAGGWADKTGGTPTLVTDTTSPSGPTVQMIDRATSGGDYSSPQVSVTAGTNYCVNALVKWVSGGTPFLGMQRFDSSGSAVDLNWLIGVSYTDPLGPVTEVSTSATGWQAVSRTLTMPTGTAQIRLVSELFNGASKGGSNLAYLDDIGIAAGACPAAASVPYVQDWESGTGGWMDRTGASPTLVTDATSPSGSKVQSIDRATVGGDYFSPWIGVTGGQTYCASIALRWLGGGAPFVGLQPSTNTGPVWLIGASGYADAFGPEQPVSASATGWQQFRYTLVMPAGATQARFSVELYSGETKPGANLAYFDGIRLVSGGCVDAPPASPVWITSWFRTPISTAIVTTVTKPPTADSPPNFNNQTVRLMLWPTTGGTQVKVKLSNLFTSFGIDIRSVHIALRSGTGANIISGSDRTLTFGGLSEITLAANSEVWSDPVALTVTAHSDIAVSIYLPEHFTPTTMMARGGLKTSYYKSGNQVSALTMTGASTTTKDVFVSEVQVLSPASANEIAVDGDSIVEGACSDPNTNGDWPDLLSNRLPSLPSGAKVGIANAGVGSGRFVSTCSPPNVNCAGPSGLSRLPDLLALPGIKYVIVSMGINDISYNSISASGLISAYQSAISQAHSAGVKIFGVPLLPIKSSVKDTPDNRATRTTVNGWITGGGTGYDGIIDFGPSVSDPNDPDIFRSDLTCDHVHPNQQGYSLMANSIDLSLFQ